MSRPLLTVAGTYRQPELWARFRRHTPHPRVPGKSLDDMMRSLSSAYYRRGEEAWLIRGLGRWDADALFDRAGFVIDFESMTEGTDLDGIDNLDELVDPMIHLTADRRTVLVRHRLLGYERTKELLGAGAMWDRKLQRFHMPVGDLLKNGEPRPDLIIPDDALDAAWDQHERIHTDDDIVRQARKAALAKDVTDLTGKEIAALVERVGDIPEWFGLPLYPYQRVGAIAVAAGHNLLADAMRVGKAVWDEEQVMTPHGYVRMKELREGSLVIGSRGEPVRVVGVFPQGVRKLFRVSFSDGASVVVDEEHLWTVITGGDLGNGRSRTMTTKNIIEGGYTSPAKGKTKDNHKYRIPVFSSPVEYEPQGELPMPAYVMGALLGDGYVARESGGAYISTSDAEVLDRVTGLTGWETTHNGRYDYYLRGSSPALTASGIRGSRSYDKRIPRAYLFASVSDRIELLRGLMDTDGWVMKRGNTCQFTTVSEGLAEDFVELVRSLGGIARVTRKAVPKGGNYAPINVTPNLPMNPFSLPRKASLWKARTKFHPTRFITDISPFGDGPATCIKVSAEDELFALRGGVLTHNTRGALAVAAMRGSRRTLIVCPPVVLTNWQRNVDECGLATLGGQNPDGVLVEFRSGRKEPEIPDSGVVIISDSLLTSRKHLQEALIEWSPDTFLFDEAHRAKNFEAARTQVMLSVAAASTFPVPMTGTPLFNTPHELAPLLEMTGHLTPIFGGLESFMESYCWQNKFGGWTPRLKTLPDLRRMLDTYVWVRRTKDQVLTDLPKVSKTAIDLDIDLKLFREAHKEVSESVNLFLDEFYEEHGRLPSREVEKEVRGKVRLVDELAEYARENGIRYISRMRRAAGLAKVPAAVEYIKDHVRSTTEIDVHGRRTYTRPLLVWTHHKEISEEMSRVIPGEVDDTAIIMGGISANRRQRLIDEFQEGRIPVLVCQISAAGVGIDLTRSSDALFVETDWVNALVQQAEERIQGVNQKRPVMLSTMVAAGTLDDRIQRIQENNAKVLDPLLGGNNDVSVVAVSDDEANSSAILIDIIEDEIRKRKKARR